MVHYHWAGGQPDNWDTGEQCVELYGGRVWNDVFCRKELSWLCKRHKGELLSILGCFRLSFSAVVVINGVVCFSSNITHLWDLSTQMAKDASN